MKQEHIIALARRHMLLPAESQADTVTPRLIAFARAVAASERRTDIVRIRSLKTGADSDANLGLARAIAVLESELVGER